MVIGVGAFSLLQLAEDDRACILQARDDRGILTRAVVAMDGHAVRGRCTLDPTKILDRDRYAMQRPLDLARSDFLLGGGRFRERGISHDIGVALQLVIEPLDPVKHRPRYFNRRQLFRMYLPPNL